MSLIPWLTKEGNRTIVTKKSEFDLEGSAIYVENFNPKELDKEENTNASYDLHVGKHYALLGDKTIAELNEGGTIRLGPGQAAIIDTMEEVWLPRTMFGLIVARQSKLAYGLENTTTKVDPGFGPGVLHMCVTNHHLSRTLEVNYNDEFCALCLFQAATGTRPLSKGAGMIQVKPGKARWPIIRKWLRRNWAQLATAIAAFGAIAWQIIDIVMRKPTP